MARVIFHIDLNAFFANAEIAKNPNLKGKPIAVAGSTRRGVISTCSYEARKYGVKSAMSTQEAIRKCKDLIIINGDYEYYEKLSENFIKIVKKYSTHLEKASIDECYADVTEKILTYSKPLDMAYILQKEIYDTIKIPCSIGIAPNKFLAKMASEMKKPMGITVLRLQEVQQKLWPIKIEEMRGIGNKTIPHIKKLNINTIGDLANYKGIDNLRNIFGKNTEIMINRANGKDDNEVIDEYELKSISTSTTLLEDIVDYTEIKGVFLSLSRNLSIRLKEENKIGYIISITIKFFDFNQITRSKKLSNPIYNYSDILENAMDLFDSNYDETPIRLIGIGLSKLIDANEYSPQLNLFDENKDNIDDIILSLNKLLPSNFLLKASDIKKRD